MCEGEPVKADGERIIITEEEAEDGSGIITTLRITKVGDEDNGKYSLLVKNSVGEAHMDSLLDVMGKPKPPKVVKVSGLSYSFRLPRPAPGFNGIFDVAGVTETEPFIS